MDSTKWALQKASKVLFVMENNYLNIKKCTEFLDIVIKGFGIWKEKISLIINKETSNGLESELIERILEDYKIIGKIKLGGENERNSYEKILETINFVPKKSLKDKIIKLSEDMKTTLEKSMPKIEFMKGGSKNAN